MAARETRTDRQQNMDRRRQMYVYGNAVAAPNTVPKRHPERETEPQVKTSPQIRRNRNRALRVNASYVKFLTFAAVCTVFVCIIYLKLQSEIVTRSETITSLQKQLEQITEENNTAYQAAEDALNLEQIRNRAVNEMGMVNAAQGRVVEYDKPAQDYVKQYSDIPEDGVLSGSRNISR